MYNSVCECEFSYKESGSELLLEFQGTFCKFQPGNGNNKGKEIGKCYIQNGELFVDIKNIPEMEGTGIGSRNYKLQND